MDSKNEFSGGYVNKDFVFSKKPIGYYEFKSNVIDGSDLEISVNEEDLEKLKERIDNCMVELIEILNEEIWDRIKSENKKKESENSDKNIGFGFFDLIDKDGI